MDCERKRGKQAKIGNDKNDKAIPKLFSQNRSGDGRK